MNYAEVYGELHQQKGGKHFSGYSILPHVEKIADLVSEHQPDRLLDYGSGKGYQYLARRVQRHWGGLLPECYDVGVHQLRARPGGKFGGIICTDVMEHIAERDVDAVLADIFSFADGWAFAFFAIACRPAVKKRLPDGRNVHLTVRPPAWWKKRLAAHGRAGLEIVARYDEG